VGLVCVSETPGKPEWQKHSEQDWNWLEVRLGQEEEELAFYLGNKRVIV